MDEIAAYLCVGDSMSIDTYPYMELTETNPAVAQGVGAGSLLYKNQPDLWPEFAGKDLVTRYPNIEVAHLATDGATTYDFLDTDYLHLVAETLRQKPVIATLTIAGNDLLGLIGIRGNQATKELDEELSNLCERFDKVVGILEAAFPRAILIFNTVYDPTDGTGKLPIMDFEDKLPWLHKMNDHIRKTADAHKGLLADVHKHFLGHGLSAPPKDRWYWEPNPIEPSAKGASEMRRLWVEALREEELL
ncbi:MAG TPA: SGNH/GDSL hydrolase family protein [Planktothrix sp.]|jgi:lysophospholipase L1-like esterase